MRRSILALALLAVTLLGPVPPAGADGERAGGTLVDSAGNAIGVVRLAQTGDTVTVAVAYGGLPAGEHGIHFHAVGRCAGPDFATAGGRFNPTSQQHGLRNPAGPHGGDLPNLVADASTATQGGYAYGATTTAVALASGPNALLDADGAALVIHANADDDVTDPAGNSGARIACAVLTPDTAAPRMPNSGAGGGSAPWLSGARLLGALVAVVGLAVARRRRMAYSPAGAGR